MSKTDYFWTDIGQASERLDGCVILYDNQPVLVEGILPHDDGCPRAIIRECRPEQTKTSRKQLNSPKFNKFRDLPKIGWTNTVEVKTDSAIFIGRTSLVSRSHGLSNANCKVSHFSPKGDHRTYGVSGGVYALSHIIYDQGFSDAHNGIYPPIDKILANIQESTAIAYSRLYCIMRDGDGVRWLYRELDKVGLFTGADTLNLFEKKAHLREEIMLDPAFTLNNIREF